MYLLMLKSFVLRILRVLYVRKPKILCLFCFANIHNYITETIHKIVQ